MLKYWIAFIALFIGTVCVSIHDKKAAKQCESERASAGPAIMSPREHAENAAACAENAKRQSPVGYEFLRWPEGTGAWAILLTLLAIVEQTREAGKSTAAVERNTSAFIESQKAILVVDAHDDPFTEIRTARIPRLILDLHNRGMTTALHCIQETWVELVSNDPTAAGFGFDDAAFTFTEAAEYHISDTPLSVYPNHPPTQLNIPIKGGLTPEQRLLFEKARLLVCVRIRFTFRDAFSPQRFADFGFWVMLQGLGHLAKYQDSN